MHFSYSILYIYGFKVFLNIRISQLLLEVIHVCLKSIKNTLHYLETLARNLIYSDSLCCCCKVASVVSNSAASLRPYCTGRHSLLQLLFQIFGTYALEKEMATHSQCSCLENPRDGGAWWAAVYGVAQSRTPLKQLSSSSSSSMYSHFQ